jgi:hypothetical protein
VNCFGGGRDAHLQQFVAEQRVDEGRFSGVKLADHYDEKEHIAQILRHVQQAPPVLRGDFAEFRQRPGDLGQQRYFALTVCRQRSFKRCGYKCRQSRLPFTQFDSHP